LSYSITIRRLLSAGFFSALLAGLLNCQSSHVTHEWWAMNSNLSLTLYGSTPIPSETVFQVVEAETQRLADLFTDFSDRSALSQVAGKNGDTISIDLEVENVIRSALVMHQASHGLFDFTLHDLKFLWGLGDGQQNRVPTQEELDSLLAENPRYHAPDTMTDWTPPLRLLGSQKVVLLRNHTRLDLGGIAKGYIVDRLHRLLDSLDCKTHLIQAGGEIRVGGHKSGKRPWIIGIRHPRNGDSLCGSIQTNRPVSVSTSGDYERFFDSGPIRYHHIFDPRTGKPSQTSVAVTVIADSSRQTDALTKPLFILGPELGAPLARQFGAMAIWFKASGDGVCAIPMSETNDVLTLKGIPLCPVH
jgi:FAD:protein FMN transferase